jgi:HTH-type transcriptional regulator/antitoxin HipB
MKPLEIGEIIRQSRKQLKLTQADLALVAGTATRFISDLENGKPSCHLGKTLSVLSALGIKINLTPPVKQEKS